MILLVVAIVLFAVASFQPKIGPVHPGWAGLAVFALSFLV